MIPGESKERIALEREPLLKTLQRVSLLLSDKSNSVKLNFTRDNLELVANSPDVGEAREQVGGELGQDSAPKLAENVDGPAFIDEVERFLREQATLARDFRREAQIQLETAALVCQGQAEVNLDHSFPKPKRAKACWAATPCKWLTKAWANAFCAESCTTATG